MPSSSVPDRDAEAAGTLSLAALWGHTGRETTRPPLDRARRSVTKSGLLSALEAGHSSAKSRHITRKRASTKEIIVFKGDPATHVFVVVTGKVKVTAPSDDGKEITFAILGPGELIGEIGLFKKSDYTATVTALEPTELAVFHHHEFLSLLRRSSALTLQVINILCERLRRASEMNEDLSFLPFPARLAKKLLELARSYGEEELQGIRIGLQLCQQELANMVGSSRESVNKQLALWQAHGLVSMKEGCLTLCRPSDLASLCTRQVERSTG